MRTYEAACVFRSEEDLFTSGKKEILSHITELGAESISEHDMGVRMLSYPIKNQLDAHYLVFKFTMEPDKAHQIEKNVALIENLIRILVIRCNE